MSTAPAFRNRIVGHAELPPSEIQPHSENWRTHPDAQAEALRDVMTHVGVVDEVIVNRRTGRLVNGHLRVRLALEAGEPTLPVKYVDLDEDEERVILASFDAIGAMATVDEGALRVLVDGFADSEQWLRSLAGAMPEVYGFDWTEPAATVGENEAPEAPENPVSRLGDLWLLGSHRLLCGDAEKAEDVARILGGVQPNLMVTDPPYGVKYDANWRNEAGKTVNRGTQRIKSGGAKKPLGVRAIGAVPNDDRADWREAWKLFHGSVAYVWHAGVHAGVVEASLVAAGFEIRNQIIWRKNRFVISRGHYNVQHEPCMYAVRKGKTAAWTGSHSESTVWDIPHPASETGHSTQKPVEAMRRPMVNNSEPGQAVYDPFVGSGTSIIAADSINRRCYAIELNPAYVDVSVRRWEKFTGQRAVRDGDGRSFEKVAAARAGQAAA